MSVLLSDDPVRHLAIERAHRQRAELLARAGYLLVRGLARAATAVIDPAARGLRRIALGIRCAAARRDTIRQLQRLDDRMLRDVGIERADIPMLAVGLLRRGTARIGPAGSGLRLPAEDIAFALPAANVGLNRCCEEPSSAA